MELQSMLTADYLDIIFNNRNKAYGGYELRKHYSQRATRATLFVLSTLLLAIGVQAFASRFRTPPHINAPVIVTTELSKVEVDMTPKPIQPEPPAVAPSVAPSTAFVQPHVVPDDKVVTDPSTIDDLRDKQPGTVTTEGNGGSEPATTLIPGTGGGGEMPTGTIESAPVVEKIVDYVEQMPQFDGDIKKYLGENIQYPEIAKDTRTSGRVVIRFVVNEDGSVTNAKVVKGIGAGCEEEALRVINSMPRWKPGKQNGKAVKVYLTLPVNFTRS